MERGYHIKGKCHRGYQIARLENSRQRHLNFDVFVAYLVGCQEYWMIYLDLIVRVKMVGRILSRCKKKQKILSFL